MSNLNDLLTRVEAAGLASFFHKDWLLQIRTLLRSQLPTDYRVFVESEAVIEVEGPVEVETHYSLLIRRGPANVLVAALELLSPSNKGLGNRFDRERHLKKRVEYLDCGISLLELDPLLNGVRDLPPPLTRLTEYDRIGWSAYHHEGRRQYRGWGWNQAEPLPQIDWQIDAEQRPVINLSETLRTAADFNDWTTLVSGIK